MKIVTTGGRNFRELEVVRKTLDTLRPSFVHVGDCRVDWEDERSGADRLVYGWCLHTGTPNQIHRAYWNKLGRAAGPARNLAMLEAAWKDGARILIAFPGGTGTKNCMWRAGQMGFVVLEVK